MGTVEKLVKSLEALKLSSDAAAAAAANAIEDAASGIGGVSGGVGIVTGVNVVSGILGAATRKKDAANLTKREKVHHCNIVAECLNAAPTRSEIF